jgi:hypothetical protein
LKSRDDISEKRIPATIKKHPAKVRGVNFSCQRKYETTAANTGSKTKMIPTWIAVVCFCATF